MSEGEEKQSTARRDHLRKIERKVQEQWEEAKAFEAAPDGKKDKFFATFPYPYMNGVLHIGHAFTTMKAEFACRYQRLLGKDVLFPFGFHCTGQPIAGAAIKLQRELRTFGYPPEFPAEEEDEGKDEKKDAAPAARSKKGKVAGKKSAAKYQWNILREMGVPAEEITRFTESSHWLKYFPPIAKEHLKNVGLCVDWRRSFITTSVNPYYDSFIQWQFRMLKQKDKIFYGKRMTVFSPGDNQPCADHDRVVGEGVGVQDYTLIKLELIPPYPPKVAAVVGKRRVFLPAATLRPETMYGQTNCFLLPEGEYGIYGMPNSEAFIQSPRSALNLSYQNATPVHASPQELGIVKGQDVIGCAVKAPLCTYPKVYVLPLMTIKMNKGTGVVTSVPSDAPDDYAALMDLKNKAPMRQKHGITDEMVMPFDVVPIIETPGLGTTPAKDLCIKEKVQSQNDTKKLEDIKARCYLDSFTKGIMLVGEFKGEKVSVAKLKIRKQMIDAGQALPYSEPEAQVISRSGSECVAALTDQHYLRYGEEKWKEQVEEHIRTTLNTYSKQAREKFNYTMGWLHEWACSRSSGLGTLVPWDQQFVIESLSDSTIYMAYYTIAHYLQSDLEGAKPGLAGIKASQLTDAVWNYLFLKDKYPKYPAGCGIPQATLDRLRQEFEYWYPLDLRVSGKDLIGNHLTMCLYNHAAVWDKRPEMWPRAFFTNGHVMINGEKMSKSTGNFLTLQQSIDKFGADATRFALADAGDSLDDANFQEETANAMVLFLTKEEVWFKETKKNIDSLRAGKLEFVDEVFKNEIHVSVQKTRVAFENMRFRESITDGFRRLLGARDDYRADLERQPGDKRLMHRDVANQFLQTMLTLLFPICPHWCQYMWNQIGKEGLIDNAGWPQAPAEDRTLSLQYRYLQHVRDLIRQKYIKKLVQKPEHKEMKVVISVADRAPRWMHLTLEYARKCYKDNDNALPGIRDILPGLRAIPEMQQNKQSLERAMQLVSNLQEVVAEKGEDAFTADAAFDEAKLLNAHSSLASPRDMPKDLRVSWNISQASSETSAALPGKPLVNVDLI
jgi:leucyl-tRNA synthetase